MKELYISPELNLICFAPVERLANNEDLLEANLVNITTYSASEPGASVEDGDFGLEIM